MGSIMQNVKLCYVCGRPGRLHKHHVYGGANRKISEKEGCWIWLCPEHHNMSDSGVHFSRELDLQLKRECQKEWERHGTREEFRQKFGKSWI